MIDKEEEEDEGDEGVIEASDRKADRVCKSSSVERLDV